MVSRVFLEPGHGIRAMPLGIMRSLFHRYLRLHHHPLTSSITTIAGTITFFFLFHFSLSSSD